MKHELDKRYDDLQIERKKLYIQVSQIDLKISKVRLKMLQSVSYQGKDSLEYQLSIGREIKDIKPNILKSKRT